ncbi:unnamed protein product, partial [Rotaria sp. Silwood2]
KKLPKLKYFSLKSYCRTFYYDSQIASLLRRMSNLEELTLLLAKQYSLPFITFSHLVKLHLNLAYIDYVEQFLYERNAHLPRQLSLQIQYETLSILKINFTNYAARVNCAKIQRLVIKEQFTKLIKKEPYAATVQLRWDYKAC